MKSSRHRTRRGMVHFSLVAHELLGEQTQYAYRYLEAAHDSPNLGTGLRYLLDAMGDYHDTWIHPDDAAELVYRVAHYKANAWCIGFDDADAMLEKALTWTPDPDDFE